MCDTPDDLVSNDTHGIDHLRQFLTQLYNFHRE